MGEDSQDVFAVRLTLPNGSSHKVQCNGETNVGQILQAVSAKVSALELGHSVAVLLHYTTIPVCASVVWLTVFKCAAGGLGQRKRLCAGGKRPR